MSYKFRSGPSVNPAGLFMRELLIATRGMLLSVNDVLLTRFLKAIKFKIFNHNVKRKFKPTVHGFPSPFVANTPSFKAKDRFVHPGPTDGEVSSRETSERGLKDVEEWEWNGHREPKIRTGREERVPLISEDSLAGRSPSTSRPQGVPSRPGPATRPGHARPRGTGVGRRPLR